MNQQLIPDLDLGGPSLATPSPQAVQAPSTPSELLDASAHLFSSGQLSAAGLRLHQALVYKRELLPNHDHSRGLAYTPLGLFMASRQGTATTAPKERGEAKKKVVIRAAKELEAIGLVTRTRVKTSKGKSLGPGTPYRWQLHQLAAPAPSWVDAHRSIQELLWSYQTTVTINQSAVFTALAYAADSDGMVQVSGDQLSNLSKLSTKRAVEALKAMQKLDAGVLGVQLIRDAEGSSYQVHLGLPVALKPWEEAPAAPATKPGPTSKPTRKRPTRAEADELTEKLWHPQLVAQAVANTEATLDEGKSISIDRLVNHILKPVVELQDQYGLSPLVEYSLQETLKRPNVFGKKKPQGFASYMRAVAKNNLSKYSRSASTYEPGSNGAAAHAVSPKGLEERAEKRLGEAAELNRAGRSEEARAILDTLLAHTDTLAVLFDGDHDQAEVHIREAYKRGLTDLRCCFDYTVAIDYLPEWSAS